MRDGDKEMRELAMHRCPPCQYNNNNELLFASSTMLNLLCEEDVKNIALCTVMIKHHFLRVTCLALTQELKTNCSYMQIGKQKLIRP
jgi:hypothetical protein